MISVIVPAYNAQRTIGACVEALLAQESLDEPYEIIVVDDGSTDATADIVRQHPVQLLTQPHAGAAAARNRGASAASGRILLFTDADCRPFPQWAAHMVAPFDDPQVAGVKGLFRSDQDALVARLVQAEYEEKEAHMLGRRRVAFADTAAAAFRADVFHAVGGFRTDMQAVEDTELSFRIAAAGHRIVVAPDALVYHEHPETVRAYARRKLRYGIWGARAYLAHPERVADDSRTPTSMRLQLVLGPLVVLTALPALAWPLLWGLVLALLIVFALTTIPFAWRARDHGWQVAWVARPMFFVRALAVSTGLAVGIAQLALERLRGEQPGEPGHVPGQERT